MSSINRVEAWTCRVPLDVPIRFRWNTIRHRDYTVVRLTTDDGHVGSAFAISRGLPTDLAVIDMLGGAVLGHDATEIGAFHERARALTAASDQYGILANARSLLDIALWDIRGKVMNAPVWKLLGGDSKPAGVLLVEGYELPGETDEAFARRLANRAAEGYPAIKLEAAGYEDMNVLRRRLELVREYAGDKLQLVVDVNGAWSSVREAVNAINAFSTVDLAWVEDPFPRHRLHDVGKLRQEVQVPLGAGDDITRPRDLFRLIEKDMVDVLRVDVATLGGFSPTADVIGVARQYEVPVSTHAYPTMHQHLAFAYPDVSWVEAFPDELPFEPSHKLMRRPTYSRIENGFLLAPQEPGLALELDDDALLRFSIRHSSLSGEDPLS
jgi:L-alanine-DL-glutamate epimerase-like enolase superfamily enzyme